MTHYAANDDQFHTASDHDDFELEHMISDAVIYEYLAAGMYTEAC